MLKGVPQGKHWKVKYTNAQVSQLVNTWEDNWITSADIDTIKSLGFNFMRVPFGWRNLQNQEQQWYLDSLGHIDFTRFDWMKLVRQRLIICMSFLIFIYGSTKT